jgi:hypothetical protein
MFKSRDDNPTQVRRSGEKTPGGLAWASKTTKTSLGIEWPEPRLCFATEKEPQTSRSKKEGRDEGPKDIGGATLSTIVVMLKGESERKCRA